MSGKFKLIIGIMAVLSLVVPLTFVLGSNVLVDNTDSTRIDADGDVIDVYYQIGVDSDTTSGANTAFDNTGATAPAGGTLVSYIDNQSTDDDIGFQVTGTPSDQIAVYAVDSDGNLVKLSGSVINGVFVPDDRNGYTQFFVFTFDSAAAAAAAPDTITT